MCRLRERVVISMINSCHDFLKIKKRPAFIMACIMILSLAMIWASPNIASARGSKTWPKGIDNQQPQKNAMPYFWGEAIRDNGLTPDDVKVNLSNKATIDDALREGQKDYMKRGDLYYSSFNKFQLQSASQWGTVGYLTSNYQGYSMMPYIPPEITRAQKGGRVYHFFDYPGDTDHGGDDDFSFVFRVNFDNTIKQAAQKKGNLKQI